VHKQKSHYTKNAKAHFIEDTVYIQGVTIIEADVWFSGEGKIPEFGSVNLDPAGSVIVFSILKVLRFSGSLNLGLSIEFSIISFISWTSVAWGQVWTQKCAVQKASVDVNISYY
jgi:hypothetical protein